MLAWGHPRPLWGVGLGGGVRHSPVGSDNEGPFRRAPPNPVVLDSEGWVEAFLKALRSAAPTGCVRAGRGTGKGRPARPVAPLLQATVSPIAWSTAHLNFGLKRLPLPRGPRRSSARSCLQPAPGPAPPLLGAFSSSPWWPTWPGQPSPPLGSPSTSSPHQASQAPHPGPCAGCLFAARCAECCVLQLLSPCGAHSRCLINP